MNRDYIIECFNRIGSELELVNVERAHGQEEAIARFGDLSVAFAGVAVHALSAGSDRNLITWTGDVPDEIRTVPPALQPRRGDEPLASLGSEMKTDREGFNLASAIEHERDA